MALLGALLAILLLPLFEYIFRQTTALTLLEHLDLSHPLLQRLAMEAPGTYQHSIVVANMAQAAAQAVGANELLARVGAYFHDIGKLLRPEYFVENIGHRENPHDQLPPQMSSRFIASHVREGLKLLREHKVPGCILDAVEQHHGTGLITFFYRRARVAAESKSASPEERLVNEEDFRYQGRKPTNREMGILALADSVEAAARALDQRDVENLERLVRQVMDTKLQDGQLDECPLTMADLAMIRRAFVFTLANMWHLRIVYPQDATDLHQPATPPAPESATAQGADPAPVKPGASA
jgi:putative nucleotidyltransferase with HDIG domain